jgi:hypothetical protein
VGIGADQLAHVRAAHRAATPREMAQAITERLEPSGDIPRGPRVEPRDIGPNSLERPECRFDPDNVGQPGSGLGQGSSFGVPRESSHAATLACGTTLPDRYAAIASASRRASSASSGSKIDRVSASAIGTILSNIVWRRSRQRGSSTAVGDDDPTGETLKMSKERAIVRGSGNVFRDLGDPDTDREQSRALLAARIIACWTTAS